MTRPGGPTDAETAQLVLDVVAAAGPVPVLVHGGPLRTADDYAALLSATTGLAGVATGSLLEVDPVRRAVRGDAVAFRRSLPGPDGPSDPLDPVRLLDERTLPGYLQERGLVPPGKVPAVESLGGGISNVVLRYTAGQHRGVAKQPRGRIRVAGEWICSPDRNHVEADAHDAGVR